MSDDESMGDFWRDVNAARQQKRASNRDQSAEFLKAAGLDFTSNNGGAHLIVSGLGKTVDFWPGTGLWMVRGQTTRRYGVRGLVGLLKPAGDTK